jgi:hypothetical protein
MTIDNDEDLKHLKSIGRIVFETMMLMKKSLKVGITTEELTGSERKISRAMARGQRPS